MAANAAKCAVCLTTRYTSDPDAIDAVVPDCLTPHASNTVVLQWVKSKSTGIGDYTKVDVFVRCCPFAGDEVRGRTQAFAFAPTSTTS